MVRLHSHQYPKWFTPQIRHQVKCVKSVCRKCTNHPTSHLIDKLSVLEQNLRADICSAKQQFELDLTLDLVESPSPNIYKYLRHLTKSPSIPSSMTSHDGSERASSDDSIALFFNNFFYSVFRPSDSGRMNLNDFPPHSSTDTNDRINFSEQDVYTELCKLNPSKAMGIDGISPKILKFCALGLYEPIHHVFKLSLCIHEIASDWKTHCIVPVFKAGDRSSVKNYRPISSCIVSKVLERIVFDCISVSILQSISTNQFGFFPLRSSVQQLLIYVSEIHLSLQSKAYLDSIYVDISKAFDSVPHES